MAPRIMRGFSEMKPTEYNGSQIELQLQGSDEEGWMSRCIVNELNDTRVTLDYTSVFPTKELAGQAAFDTACRHIDSGLRARAKRTRA
jgi:hypothetical protein